MWTWGGRQFWSDLEFAGPLRLQKRVRREQYRVLDECDYLRFQGSYKDCRQWMKSQQGIVNVHNHQPIVLLLHGIVRSSKCFRPLKTELTRAGFVVYPIDYPSTRFTIAEAADQLQHILQHLPERTQVHFVCHSMGGLVVRAWYGKYAAVPRSVSLGNLIMLGTPNQGAELADWLKNFWPYRWIFGPAGGELGKRAESSPSQLAIPELPIGIIAGGRGPNSGGYNPLLPGDDDGTVTVASTQLNEAADFLLVRSIHATLMRHPQAIAAVKSFLNTGAFQKSCSSGTLPTVAHGESGHAPG